MVTEDRKRLGLFAHMNVRENTTLCALADFATGGMLRRKNELQATAGQIKSLQIKASGSEAMITSLSGGNQQKCIIGGAC